MARKSLINVCIVLVAVAAGLATSRSPWQVLSEQRERTERQEAEMRRLENLRESLVREQARYQSSIGKEELARERNFLPPNEVPAP